MDPYSGRLQPSSEAILDMKNLRIPSFFLSIVTFVGCGGPEYETKYYQAVSMDKRDTASLKLLVSDKNFYGDYQINYNGHEKDHGTINGHVKGDTLIGKFNYLSRDNVKSTEPIALLKDNEKLRLGTGKIGTYLGLRVYKFGSISFNDSLFQFYPLSGQDKSMTKNMDK